MNLDYWSKALWNQYGGEQSPPLCFPQWIRPDARAFLEDLWSGKLSFFRPWSDVDLVRYLFNTHGLSHGQAGNLVWDSPDLEEIWADRERGLEIVRDRKEKGFSSGHCGLYLRGKAGLPAKKRWTNYLLNPESLERKRARDRERQRRLRKDKSEGGPR
jgi:hypothetical protein